MPKLPPVRRGQYDEAKSPSSEKIKRLNYNYLRLRYNVTAPRSCHIGEIKRREPQEHESHGHKTQVFKGWEQVKPGTMTPLQFDQTVGDLVNYLQWMGEPAQNTRVRVEANPFRVEPGRTYHWRIERRGATINWFIDGAPFMSFTDPMPLTGKGHNRFGFLSWESWLYFDNLSVTAL